MQTGEVYDSESRLFREQPPVGQLSSSAEAFPLTDEAILGGMPSYLSAETYERDLGNVPTLQAEVARAIVAEIKVRLTPHEQTHLATRHPVNPDAYRLCLLGRFHWNKRREGFKNAIEQFQRGIKA